jgi:PAS domain S-box-containing protein
LLKNNIYIEAGLDSINTAASVNVQTAGSLPDKPGAAYNNGNANELLNLQMQLAQMTAFAMQGEQPVLKINKKGRVLIANEAARLLGCFKNGISEVQAAEFWPLIIAQANNPGQNLSAKIGEKTYSFTLKAADDCESFFVSGTAQSVGSYMEAANENQHIDFYREAAIASFRNTSMAGDLQLKLSQTASRLRALLSNMHAGVMVEDEFGNISLINKTFCELFSLGKDPAELEGKPARELYNIIGVQFRNSSEFIKDINTIILQRRHQVQQKLERADGKVYIRHFIANIGDDGEYFGHMSLYRDITDVITLENNLEEQRRFYENILNSLPADIVVFDKHQRYRFLNPGAIPEDDLRSWVIGKTDEEYCRLRNRPVAMTAKRQHYFLEAVAKKSLVSYEEEIAHEDGLTKTYLRNFYPVLDEQGEVFQVILYGIDITDRKVFEQNLGISEKRYRGLINNSQALILTHDLWGKITSINPAVTQTLGFTSEEMIGSNLSSFLSDNTKAIFETEYLEYLKKENRIEGVFKINSKSGEVFYLLFKNIVFYDEGNEPYVIAFAQDISKRVRAEKNLEKAILETERVAKSKQRFLANMSHEIRTPMNGIIGITQLLADTPLSMQQAEYVNLIRQSADNLLVIVNDILDLEKIVSGKLTLENITFLLHEKVRMIYEAFRLQAQEKRVLLQLNYNAPAGLWVKGDPYRLTQILNNLVGNAIKFTNQGSVKIIVSISDVTAEKVQVAFSVADTGIGINASRLEDVFEPYVQERSETARKFGGTGLGLPISKKLVEVLGGNLTVESTYGQGSVFTFTIPFLKSEPLAPVKSIESPSYEMMRGKKVLVAEDVAVNQYLVKHILKNWGCDFAIAANGLEAVELLQKKDWDIVLMDIQMPVMDGMEATKQIRNMTDLSKASVPVVALTANALNGDEIKYREAGMNGYLAKPYTEKALFSVISNLLAEGRHVADTALPRESLSAAAILGDTLNNEPVLYDLQMLEEMSGGDQEFVKMMAELFMNTTPPLLEELLQASNSKNWELACKVAHKLKPTIESMGIKPGTLIIKEIEQLAKQQPETALVSGKVNQFADVINLSIKQMRNYFS